MDKGGKGINMRVETKAGTGRSDEWRSLLAMMAFFGVALLLGTFVDEPFARAVYMPLNVPLTLVTTVGIYPFATAIVLFLGVALERVAHSGKGQVYKVALGAVTLLLALFVGFVGGASLVDGDCLGSLFPGLSRNYAVIAVLSAVLEWPMIPIGWRLASQSDDKLLLRKAVCLVIVLLLAFAAMQVGKAVFHRPRFRAVAQGLEGVGFVPWYTISPDPADLMSKYDLTLNEFRSFPSGHAILSISTISILLSLTWLFPGLRTKRVQLCWAGFAFAIVIIVTRLLLGAHYISDVSAGALIGLVCVLVYEVTQRRIAGSAG